MRILLVEDDRPLSDALALSLKNANYAVDCVYTGADAMTTLSIGQTDIVVLDLGLPDTDGLNVLKSIRKKNATLPVLILTARDKVSDKISGLDAGADDYLPKPFEIDELLARLRVLERRLGTASQTIITIKNRIRKSFNSNTNSCRRILPKYWRKLDFCRRWYKQSNKKTHTTWTT